MLSLGKNEMNSSTQNINPCENCSTHLYCKLSFALRYVRQTLADDKSHGSRWKRGEEEKNNGEVNRLEGERRREHMSVVR